MQETAVPASPGREVARPNILYVVHRVPYPPDKGDRIRAFHILRYLHAQANVDVACLADEAIDADTVAALQKHCRRLAIVKLGTFRWARALLAFMSGRTLTEGAFASSKLRDCLVKWASATRYQAVLASASSMVPYLRIRELDSVPAVVDLVDVDSQKWLDYARSKGWPKSWLLRAEARRLRRLEADLPTWVRAVTLVSDAEADLYRQFASAEKTHSVTNGVDLDYFRNDSVTPVEPLCVFVGALDYYPNVDAACWFCERIWPQIQARRPQARLLLVGRNPVRAVRQLGSMAGVEVVGSVPDVRPYLQRAAAVVVPLRIARGLQNKVLEGLAMNKAVVASPEALAALRVEPGTHLLKASTPSEWVEAIASLLDDPNRRTQLGNAGRRYVEENHNWATCLTQLRSLLVNSKPAAHQKQLASIG